MRTDAFYWHCTYWDIWAEFKRAVDERDLTRTSELLDALKLCARIRDNTRSR